MRRQSILVSIKLVAPFMILVSQSTPNGPSQTFGTFYAPGDEETRAVR